MKKISILFPVLLFLAISSSGQLVLIKNPDQELLNSRWDASWISVPGTDPLTYGVYFYRNTLDLETLPEAFLVHLSADNRYKFFVNGEFVGLGPARSDTDNWNFDTYDMAPYLVKGTNVISVQTWNFGYLKPWGQLSQYSGFIMQGNSDVESGLNTPGSWKCRNNNSYTPVSDKGNGMNAYRIVGPGDHVNGNLFPWGWQESSFNDSEWNTPRVHQRGTPKGLGSDLTHALVPRTIPAMEHTPIESPHIRKIDDQVVKTSLNQLVIPANTNRTILLDQGYLVTAYPEILLSGGKNASLKIAYSETLFNSKGKKEHRDSINQMFFKGMYDIFNPDGGKNRLYTTLWFRTFRYIQIEVSTSNEPLMIHSLTPIYTAYPFKEKARFEAPDAILADIWETGWRTSRLCANEIFYDCPYYEQLQYVGDTRVQALISLYVSGDDRLMRKAINDFYNSIIPEGLTLSRYPSDHRQVIPTFSLLWISMIHDYLWHSPDFIFTSKYLVSIQHILQWFENRIDEESGMLGPIEYWPFVDWALEWPWDREKGLGGVPAGGMSGNSSILTLQYAITLDQAADIFSFYGLETLAKDYISKADQLVEATYDKCWDEDRQFFADTPEKLEFSQHANIFAVLANAVPTEEKALLIERTARSRELIQTSYYFKFYLHRAMAESGLGNKFLEMLTPWEKMLEMGLTTFAEMHDLNATRSDAHAWSSSPLYDFLATVAGIRPSDAGFRSLIIEPHPGNLPWLKTSMPHYKGMIDLDLKFNKKGKVRGEVILPPGLTGIFVWDKQTIDLKSGVNKISMGSLDEKFNPD